MLLTCGVGLGRDVPPLLHDVIAFVLAELHSNFITPPTNLLKNKSKKKKGCKIKTTSDAFLKKLNLNSYKAFK